MESAGIKAPAVSAGRSKSRRGLPELERWSTRYRESVGPAADACVVLLQKLLRCRAPQPADADLLLELLEILESLLADPITISCAMVHAAGRFCGVSHRGLSAACAAAACCWSTCLRMASVA